MSRSRFRGEQIIGIIRRTEAGMHVLELCRQNCISDVIFYIYKWQSKFGAWKCLKPGVGACWRRKGSAKEDGRRLGAGHLQPQ